MHDDGGPDRLPVAMSSAPVVTADAKIRPPRKKLFEVELTGDLGGERGDGNRVVFVATEPCRADNIERVVTVAMSFVGPRFKSGHFSAEAVARDGTQFYLCAFALDTTDRLVGFGDFEHNPIVIRESDKPEVEVEDIDITVARTAPRQLPKGRYRSQ
jgi:hypothetical protein